MCDNKHDKSYYFKPAKCDWECCYCHKIFESSKLLAKHKKECDSFSLDCKFCGKHFAKSCGLVEHERVCAANPNKQPPRNTKCNFNVKPKESGWKCTICNSIFRTRRELYDHKKNQHSSEKIKPLHTKCEYMCSFCGKKWITTSSGHTLHETYCIDNPCRKEHCSFSHTDKTKKLLSEIRNKCLEDGTGNHWVNPSIKRSYAEQYFYDCFTNANISFKNNLWVGRYCLDFVVGNNYFEVDGKSHYTHEGITHDSLRELYLKDRNYICIGRCNWSEFCRLSSQSKKAYINDIISKLVS